MKARLCGDVLLKPLLGLYGRDSDGTVKWVLEPGDPEDALAE